MFSIEGIDRDEVDRRGRARRSRRWPRARRLLPTCPSSSAACRRTGLIEMPPLSKVTPLPTSPSVGAARRRPSSAGRSAAAPSRSPGRRRGSRPCPRPRAPRGRGSRPRPSRWRRRSRGRGRRGRRGRRRWPAGSGARGRGWRRRRRRGRSRRSRATSSAPSSVRRSTCARVLVAVLGCSCSGRSGRRRGSSRTVETGGGAALGRADPGDRASASKRPAWRTASAAATRARSVSKSSRLPRPTTSSRAGASGRTTVRLLKLALASSAPGASAKYLGKVLAFEQADAERDRRRSPRVRCR